MGAMNSILESFTDGDLSTGVYKKSLNANAPAKADELSNVIGLTSSTKTHTLIKCSDVNVHEVQLTWCAKNYRLQL